MSSFSKSPEPSFTFNKVSSTSLKRAEACLRAWWYEYVCANKLRSNRAMDFGTLFHAHAEVWYEKGRAATRAEMQRMEGNYEPPWAAAMRNPGLFAETAAHIAALPEEVWDWLDEQSDEIQQEIPMEAFGLAFCDGQIRATGFYDLVSVDKEAGIGWVGDWKTRGSFSYAPKTQEDFEANTQLMYYAAALAKHEDLERVRINHINVSRRDKGRFIIHGHEITRDKLEAHWAWLETDLVPRMLEFASAQEELDVPESRSACGDYGGCRFRSGCTPADPEERRYFEARYCPTEENMFDIFMEVRE